MSLPTINKFLLCLELETAGIIIGWMSIIGFGSAYIFLAIIEVYGWFLGGVIQPDQSLIHQLILMLKFDWFYFLYIFYCFWMAVAGIKLIRGTRNRNHEKMRMFLALTIVGVIVSPIFIMPYFSNLCVEITLIILTVVAHLFAFINIYSLHQKFKQAASYETL